MTNIFDVLIDLNPWWKNKFNLEYKPRDIYTQIQKFIPLPQIIAFTGLRRVGKTTLMRKIIADHISQGHDPQNIIYFSFDEFRNVEIREIIRVYERNLEKDMHKGHYLVLLDEIPKLHNWEDKLKALYDIFKERVKFIISGSESLFIKKKSKETLAGRVFDFKIDPLCFSEFLTFQEKLLTPTQLYKKELYKLFREYKLMLGFPELVGINDKAIIKKYIKESILERIIFKDIPLIFNIRDITVLETLYYIICDEPGQLIDYSNLAKELKITRQSISNYIKYLEQSFLVIKLYNYSKNRRKLERKLKKYYPVIPSVDQLFKKDQLMTSKIFEWLVVTQLKGEFFWRDAYKNEVDLILGEDIPIPVEIKFGKITIKGLLAFMKKYNVHKGFVISPDKEDIIKHGQHIIEIIPAYQFLLSKDREILSV